MRPITKATLLTLSAAAAASCSPHRVTHNPEPPLELNGQFTETAGSAPMPERWWTDFGDPQLTRLIETALRDNFQMRAAWARIDQARALVRQANSGKWPQLDASAQASRQKLRFDFGEQGEITPEVNQFSLSLAAGYEVDLWRRIGNQAAGATLDAMATRDDAETLALGIAAEVSEAWFDVVTQMALKRLIEEQLETNEKFFELLELRFRQGLASALDVHQQEQQLIAVRSQLPLIESALAAATYRLALLTGTAPGQLEVSPGDALPDLPPLPSAGIPADLLDRRPDVRAMRRRVEAADYRVAVAVADRLPSLRLSGSVSLQDASPAGLIARPLWSLLAGITAPLFDGRRRKAEVERTEAVVDELLMTYGQTLLEAMVEVESALVAERQQIQYIADLREQEEVLTASLTEARARYRNGLIDYLPVLASLQAQQEAQVGILRAERQLFSYRIQLLRALGGTWTRELAPAEPGDSQ